MNRLGLEGADLGTEDGKLNLLISCGRERKNGLVYLTPLHVYKSHRGSRVCRRIFFLPFFPQGKQCTRDGCQKCPGFPGLGPVTLEGKSKRYYRPVPFAPGPGSFFTVSLVRVKKIHPCRYARNEICFKKGSLHVLSSFCTYPDMRKESINGQTVCQIRSLEIGQGHTKAEMARAREAEQNKLGGTRGQDAEVDPLTVGYCAVLTLYHVFSQLPFCSIIRYSV